MRELQEERKKLGLSPGDNMPLSIEKIYKKDVDTSLAKLVKDKNILNKGNSVNMDKYFE